MPRRGLEPPRDFTPTRSLIWRVCQFRHLGYRCPNPPKRHRGTQQYSEPLAHVEHPTTIELWVTHRPHPQPLPPRSRLFSGSTRFSTRSKESPPDPVNRASLYALRGVICDAHTATPNTRSTREPSVQSMTSLKK